MSGITNAFLKMSGVIGLEDMTEILIDDTKKEADLETGLEVISLKEVSMHCTMEDGYLMKQPGGEDVMMEYLGYDATMAFRGVGHCRAVIKMLEKYVMGVLLSDERLGLTADFT